jgi:hypothetical protein
MRTRRRTGAALLATMAVAGGCSSGGFLGTGLRFPGSGGGSQSGSSTFLGGVLGSSSDGAGALWWLGFAGGISCLVGVWNAARGGPVFTPILVGVGLVLANFALAIWAQAIFLVGVVATLVIGAVFTYRAIRAPKNGRRIAKEWADAGRRLFARTGSHRDGPKAEATGKG